MPGWLLYVSILIVQSLDQTRLLFIHNISTFAIGMLPVNQLHRAKWLCQ
jgi:hypothetical protein